MIIRSFDTSTEPLMVAEIGNNHEGSFDLAKELVHRAAEAGAHAVKFQTFKTELFVSPVDKERYARLSSFELSFPQFEALQQLTKSLGLLFLSTPLDIESAKFLRGLVDCYKVASSDNRFYPLIDYLCETGLPIIVSSGLSDLNEIKETKEFICKRWPAGAAASNLGVLHCVSSYPCIPEEANLRAIPLLASELKCTVGYSVPCCNRVGRRHHREAFHIG
jgi:sialic acid synthase SpsE